MPLNEVMQWVSFVRDVGLILGVPVLIGIGVKLFNQQIEILKARNELLKETQYDRAVTLLKSQKEVFLVERADLEKKLITSERLLSEKDASLSEVLGALQALQEAARQVIASAVELNAEALEAMLHESKESMTRKPRVPN
jgi:hypothetical protein